MFANLILLHVIQHTKNSSFHFMLYMVFSGISINHHPGFNSRRVRKTIIICVPFLVHR